METSTTLEKQSQSAAQGGTAPAGEPVGVVPGLVGTGVDLAGAGVRTWLGLIGEVRGQTFTLTTQSIDFAEAFVRGMCDLGRRSAKRVDQAVGETLGAIERVTMSALGAVRTTTDQAARLAMTVAEGTIGPRRATGNKN